MNPDEAAKRLYHATRTIVEMCQDRGYLVDQDDAQEGLDEFILRFRAMPS